MIDIHFFLVYPKLHNGLRIEIVARTLIKCTELKSTHQAGQKLFLINFCV
jgi:hypothetical protein